MAISEKDHQLLWNYIDQDCSEAEQEQVQKRAESGEPWHEELQQKLLLHEVMQSIEPRHTSMRFVKSIMENLPDFNAKVVIPPLIPKDWIRNFIAASILFITALMVVSWGNAPMSSSGQTLQTVSSQLMSQFESIPLKQWTQFASLLFGILTLLALDRFLKHWKMNF